MPVQIIPGKHISAATKVDEKTISVTIQPATPDPVEQSYDVNFLVAQRARILADAQAYADARQAEIDNIDGLLALAEDAGVVPAENMSVG